MTWKISYNLILLHHQLSKPAPCGNNQGAFILALFLVLKSLLIASMKNLRVSLQLHPVGCLVEAPSSVNILTGMWHLKQKHNKFSQISKYKARRFTGSNNHIKGVNFYSNYASVGLTDTL